MYTSEKSNAQVFLDQIGDGRWFYTDSEWDDTLPSPWISSAIYDLVDNITHFFIRKDISGEIRERLDKEAERIGNVTMHYTTHKPNQSFLKRVWKRKCHLFMFYSPRDLYCVLNGENIDKAIMSGTLYKRGNNAGKVGNVRIKDFSGWSGKTGLSKMAEKLGIPMLNKSSMDKYKSCMWEGLNAEPELFLRYSVDDAVQLYHIHVAFLSLVQTIQKDILQMNEEDTWLANDIPMTEGSLVSKTVERWVYGQSGDLKDAFKFAIRKLGIPDPSHKEYTKENLVAVELAHKTYRTVDDIRTAIEKKHVSMTKAMKMKMLTSAMNSASVKSFADRPVTETTVFNALVCGGRGNNEMPMECVLENGADIDISGCYGDALRHMVYPVGLPKIWSFAPKEKHMTLGEWYDSVEDELVPGLWQVFVSGELPFDQDLLFSKLAEYADIKKSVWTADRDDSDIDAEFALLRREVKNGVITHDLFETLRKVASNTEWAAISKVEVVTASAYLASDRIGTIPEWIEHVLQDDCGITTDNVKFTGTIDRRTRKWVGIPLEDFVGKLVDERAKYKKMGNEPMQEMMKRFTNMVYGSSCCRHFEFNNCIVANNITGRARTGVWMVAKALGLRQCITDGGLYTPWQLPVWKHKKPGLKTFANMGRWLDRNRYTRCYVSMDKSIMENSEHDRPAMDRAAMEHIREFWKPYRLEFPFRLEHKPFDKDAGIMRLLSKRAYFSKCDYASLDYVTGRIEYKLRGKDKNRRDDPKRHPTYTILENLLLGNDDMPSDFDYVKGGRMLSISEFKHVQSKNGFEKLRHLKPGDWKPEETRTARYNNTHLPCPNETTFKRRSYRKDRHRGVELQWFERFHSEGISGVIKRMEKDTLKG